MRPPRRARTDRGRSDRLLHAFEKGAEKLGGGDGFADVWKRGFFGCEYKGKGSDLRAAYRQLVDYKDATRESLRSFREAGLRSVQLMAAEACEVCTPDGPSGRSRRPDAPPSPTAAATPRRRSSRSSIRGK